MRVLVTGGAGFVGSHVCAALQGAGHDVGVLDSGVRGVDFAPPELIAIINSRLEGCESLRMLDQFDAVVHCAARADVASNWDDISERDDLWDSNIGGTIALLEAMPGVPIVMLSTCAIYGDSAHGAEGGAYPATSPYAASKLAGEAVLQAYAHRYLTPWHVLRLGCVVGSNYHHGHIADFVQMARAGAFRPRNSGYGAKSFVHADDVADACVMAVEGRIQSGVYNCVSDIWSPRETVDVMGLEGIEWPANTHGWVGDPLAIASNTKLIDAGWRPQRTIRQGVREALVSLGWHL